MEKISRIIPSSARVENVEMEGAQPRRPGSPNFGAPEGTSAYIRSMKQKVVTVDPDATYSPDITEGKKVLSQGEIVQRVADDFFAPQSQSKPGSVVTGENLSVEA